LELHWVDLSIFIIYMILMLGIGIYFSKKNNSADDYYVGGRTMNPTHIGLSVVATDVGGGFSIGLGGLGFTMGISGSWMLFTGLFGAWLAAVFLIPRLYQLKSIATLTTFPQMFKELFDARTAMVAGIISAIGYIGFTSSQLLAGAKLASSTFTGLEMNHALLIMGAIAVIYTAIGGIKAVIFTDTIQWIFLLSGLIFIGIPLGYIAIGGYEAIVSTLPPELLSLTNLSWVDLVNWSFTIVPIWFVGMTLYQRIYACGNVKNAKKAWYVAGLFEWPIMAFLGTILGLFARVALEQGMFAEQGFTELDSFDPETGLPIFLSQILPVGIMGLMMSAYFSAILSTADSCLMAASGNVISDILKVETGFMSKDLRRAQIATFVLGVLALILATVMTSVLELMLYSYAFMVSGLFVPVIFGLFTKMHSSLAAFLSMLFGGTFTLILMIMGHKLPFGLDPNIMGISISFITYLITYKIHKNAQY
jgi:SSS family solute:Na+ symporter